jgi:serine/threonine protein kinase
MRKKTMNATVDLKAIARKQNPLAKNNQAAEIDAQEAAVESAVVDDGLLTPYQSRMIGEGRGAELSIGPYRILDVLGRGTFGTVFKAEHSIMKRIVALKVAAPAYTNDQHWLVREVRAATRLVHPNIAMAYDANVIDGVLSFAMEFVDGMNLQELVAVRGPVPIPLACAVMRQTALAFQCAHEKGIVHRDVKPANILIAESGADGLVENSRDSSQASALLVKVVDFGLARVHPKGAPDSFTIEKDGGLFGTPAYVAPEQALNVHNADIRSDLYSLGCTIYFALAGHPPFSGSSTQEILSLHREQEPKSLELIRPDIPGAVLGIIRRLMAKKPEHRFQTPAELLEALAYAQISCTPNADTDAKAASAPAKSPSHDPGSHPPQEDFATKVAETAIPAHAESPAAEARLVDSPSPPSNNAPIVIHPIWQKWSGLLETLANRLQCRVEPEEYATQHRALLMAIRSHTDDQDPARRDVLTRLESLVEPWLTLKILRDLDHRTQLELWRNCQKIDAELFPVPASSGIMRWLLMSSGCSLLAFLVFLLMTFLRAGLSP